MKRLWLLRIIMVLASCPVWGSEPVQQPSGCLGRVFPCALEIKERRELQVGAHVVGLQQDSVLILHSENDWQLVEGALWAPSLVNVKLRFGALDFFLSGGVLARREKGELRLFNLDGEVLVQGGKLAHELPAGFENWYRGVKREGGLDQGILRAVDAKAFLTEWNQTAELSSAQIEKYFARYKERRQQAVLAGAELYKGSVIAREVASLERDRAVQLVKARKKREQDEIRDLFRQRYFQPPELDPHPTMD